MKIEGKRERHIRQWDNEREVWWRQPVWLCWPRIRAVLGWRQTDQFVAPPPFYFRGHTVISGWNEPLGQPWRKKEIPWSVWRCEYLREDSQLWGWERWGYLTGERRFIDRVYFMSLKSFLAPIAGITSFTCCLLESWPSSSMGGLSYPTAGPSLKGPIAREWEHGAARFKFWVKRDCQNKYELIQSGTE